MAEQFELYRVLREHPDNLQAALNENAAAGYFADMEPVAFLGLTPSNSLAEHRVIILILKFYGDRFEFEYGEWKSAEGRRLMRADLDKKAVASG